MSEMEQAVRAGGEAINRLLTVCCDHAFFCHERRDRSKGIGMTTQRLAIIRGAVDVEEGLAALVGIDPRLRAVAGVAGPLPLRLMEPGFAGLAHIIVSQMVSRSSADAIWNRVLAAIGEVTAERYLALEPAVLSQLGLSRAKSSALRQTAEAVSRGELDLAAIAILSAEEAKARLTSLRGIGPWTAEVYLMFCGGHADVFPAGDVALRTAVGAAFGVSPRPSSSAVEQMALAWRPWRSIAARLFWAYYAAQTGRKVTPLQETPRP